VPGGPGPPRDHAGPSGRALRLTRPPTSPGPSISVVICAYTQRRWDELVAAVASVRHQTPPAAQIIVSVDHNDALLERVSHDLPGVVVTANQERRGLSGARNSGAACATGEVVAFLDDDAVAGPDWLAWLGAGYERPEVLGVGGAIEPLWAAGRPRCFPEEFDWVVGCTYRGMPEEPAPVRNLIGANMSFRRDALRLLGGFDGGIGRVGTRPLGCEETELCIRAGRRWPNGIFLYDPRARIRHHVPADRATWHYFRSRCWSEGLSKALVAQVSGARRGLASERTYATRVLPRAMARGVADAIAHRDPAGLGRSAMILAGLTVTAAGYLVGTASRNGGGTATRPSPSANTMPPGGAA
jgi:GT2 family glycosyltransferase